MQEFESSSSSSSVDSSPSSSVVFVIPGWEMLDRNLPNEILDYQPFVKTCQQFTSRNNIDLLRKLQSHNVDTATLLAATTAIQLTFIEQLKEAGVEPDFFIGCSFGEIVAGYLDGCYDADDAIRLSYVFGEKIDEYGSSKNSSMISVACGQDELLGLIGKTSRVHVTVFNSDQCVTVTGYKHDIAAVVEKLKADGIKSTAIDTNGIAFNSPCVDFLWETSLDSVYKIISSPKKRSKKWISSTMMASEDSLRLSCPRYFLKALTSPVQYKAACEQLKPADETIFIEINFNSSKERETKENFAYFNSTRQLVYKSIPFTACLNNNNGDICLEKFAQLI